MAKRAQWDMLLHICSRRFTTVQELKLLYPRKLNLEAELEELARRGVIWIGADGKVCSLLMDTSGGRIESIKQHTDAKLQMAQYVCNTGLIEWDDLVFFGTGSSVAYIAQQLAFTENRIDVVTNSPMAWNMLESSNTVQELSIIGGRVASGAVCLPEGVKLDATLSRDPTKAFLGVLGISASDGLFCRPGLVHLNQEALKLTRRGVYLLAHEGKLGKVAGERFASYEDLGKLQVPVTIITNTPQDPTPEWSETVAVIEERCKKTDGQISLIKDLTW